MKWEMVKIQDVLYFQEGPGVRNHQFTNKGVKLLNVGNINEGTLNLNATKIYISEKEAYGKYSHFLVDEGDLLIASSGIVVDNFHNKIAWAKKEHLPLCMNTSTIRFKTKDDNIFNIKFFSFFLRTRLFTNQLQKLITGSAQLNFGPSHLKQIFVPLPPLATQRRIAEILDKADALRQKDQALLQKYDELAQAVFVDMFGDPVRNEKGWEVRRLTDCCQNEDDIKCGPFGTQLHKEDFKNEGVPLWGIKDVNKHFSLNPREFLSNEKSQELNQYSIIKDDLVMTRKGTVGNCSVYPFEKSGIMHSDLLRIRVNKSICNPTFLSSQFMLSEYILNQISQISQGAIMAGINVSKLKQLNVHLPSIKEQSKFERAINNIKAQEKLIKSKQTTSLFQSLLQKAFTGELVE